MLKLLNTIHFSCHVLLVSLSLNVIMTFLKTHITKITALCHLYVMYFVQNK